VGDVGPAQDAFRLDGIDELHLLAPGRAQSASAQRILGGHELPTTMYPPSPSKNLAGLEVALGARHCIRTKTGRAAGALRANPTEGH